MTRVIPATRFVPRPTVEFPGKVTCVEPAQNGHEKLPPRGFERYGNTPENRILQVRSDEQPSAWVGRVGATFPICA